ncbi:RluA family pseudouridine synthase [Imbroritus primus]|uniref:RluA family pseudouridine synthase n=1 Tax=Imbroritus primus TaxID=3058603 RepID=UPI003D160A40
MVKISAFHYIRTPSAKSRPAADFSDVAGGIGQPASSDDTDFDENEFDGLAMPGTTTTGHGEFAPVVFEAGTAQHGQRLDKSLAAWMPAFSRSRIQQWIEHGAVQVNGKPSKTKATLMLGDRIDVAPEPAPEDLAFAPADVPLDVVYEDDSLLVINKPAGLVVHPAAGNWSGTVLNGVLYRDPQASRLPRAGIVHRLDKETSGLMVIARTLTAQTDLVRQLQARTVKRTYLALVWGEPPESGTIDAPIGRDPRERTRMAIIESASGKPACTHFETLQTVDLGRSTISLVRCQLETGRTHQIRVHFQAFGYPLVGDPVYARAVTRGRAQVMRAPLPLPFERQALHAFRLGLRHPVDGRTLEWRAAPPADMLALMDALGFETDADDRNADD